MKRAWWDAHKGLWGARVTQKMYTFTNSLFAFSHLSGDINIGNVQAALR
jgi:hypothetical protein